MQFIYQILVPNSSYKKSYVLDVCVCVLFKKLEFLYGTARVKHFLCLYYDFERQLIPPKIFFPMSFLNEQPEDGRAY